MPRLVKLSTIAIALVAFATPAFCQSDSQAAGSQQSIAGSDGPQFGAAPYGSASGGGEGFGTAGFGGGSAAPRTDYGGEQVQVENANGETTRCRAWTDKDCNPQ